MRSMALVAAFAAPMMAGLLAFGPGGAAHAFGPAVSQTNGKFSLEGGYGKLDGEGGDGLGLAQGSITVPVWQQFGLQIDALAGTAFGRFAYGAGGQFFWRDPQSGLIGAFGQYTGIGSAGFGRAGVVGELYVGIVTIAPFAGYQFKNENRRIDIRKGVFGGADLDLYADPNFMISVGGGYFAHTWAARGGFEHQLHWLRGLKNTSVFVNAQYGGDKTHTVSLGLRYYFGADKWLIKRHREDDPRSRIWDGVGAIDAKSGPSPAACPPDQDQCPPPPPPPPPCEGDDCNPCDRDGCEEQPLTFGGASFLRRSIGR